MSPMSSHQLANIRRRELALRTRQREILSMDGQTALDAILDDKSPAALIQSFPDQDLYFLMNHIGPYDFLPVLARAASRQWEYILDMEVWEGDRLSLPVMTKGFDLMFRADPERFLRWIITEKPDYFEFYLSKHMEIKIREHDEPPPSDYEDYITVDDKFYFRFPEEPSGQGPAGQDRTTADLEPDQALSDAKEAPELIETMVKKLADMDLSVYHGLILETLSLLPAETEEEQFRLKNVRLAEKGFLPHHEAVGIYQPTPLENIRKRPGIFTETPDGFDPEIPLPPQCTMGFPEGEYLFVRALNLLAPEVVFPLESEMAALVNKIISADRIRIRDAQTLSQTLEKAAAYLSLGLEVILKDAATPEKAKAVIQDYFLEDIFRTGSRAGIKLKTRAVNWYTDSFINQNNLPLSFLGEAFLGIIGGLFLERPLYFDNYAAGDLYRPFKTLADIRRTRQALDRIICLDRMLGRMVPPVSTFEQGVLTYKSLILTLWAKDRIGLAPDLSPMDPDTFKPFFAALFDTDSPDGQRDEVSGDLKGNDLKLWAVRASGMDEEDLPAPCGNLLAELMAELREEYGNVRPEGLDPRFVPHFLLK